MSPRTIRLPAAWKLRLWQPAFRTRLGWHRSDGPSPRDLTISAGFLMARIYRTSR